MMNRKENVQKQPTKDERKCEDKWKDRRMNITDI